MKILWSAAFALTFMTALATGATAQDRPNFLVILVDDAAYMDFEPFGGEAHMPSVSALASRGTMFTNYRTSPLCAPSRAMLLTGLDNHQTGVSTIPEVLPPELEGQPGYTLSLEPGVLTVADRLRDAGYRTLMSGKWHLGHGEGELPVDHGFDRSFLIDGSGADNYDHRPYMPYYHYAPWFEDDEFVEELPDDFYSSEFLVDRMIQYLDETTDQDQPFFAYLPFQAIHIPIQVPREYTDRYNGVYDEGWEVLRERRHARAIELGLVPEGTQLAPAPDALTPWAEMSDEMRAMLARSMQVNAGMLEAMDYHIGRLVAHLEATGELDNTVIIITSDNGPEFNHLPMTLESRMGISWRNFIGWQVFMHRYGYTWDHETLGERNSYGFIGPQWAFAASSPFDLFKFYGSEGGLRVPMIVAGPGIVEGARTEGLSFVSDITPTIMDLAGVNAPDDEFFGRSLRGLLEGAQDAVYGSNDAIGIEVSGNAALYRGEWKITRNHHPWGDGEWRLYNMATDPGETQNLATTEPELFASMLEAYAAYEEEVGVLPLPAGYSAAAQVAINTNAKNRLTLFVLGLIAVSTLLLTFGLFWFGVRRLFRR
jgi:arylsulfatase/uncharacterized sulfatase